jgi:hypothetical protein
MSRKVKKIYMPMSGGTIYSHSKKHINGCGYGSVLLNGGVGGPGVGSTYSSIDDYINTTGHNISSKGSGLHNLSSISSKLEALKTKTNKKKEKNINFNL